MTGYGGTAGTAQTQASTELGHNLVVNPDGTFTVIIGLAEPCWAANYLDDAYATTDGTASLLIRDMLGDWALGPGSVSIRCVADCPASFAIPESLFSPAMAVSPTRPTHWRSPRVPKSTPSTRY